MTKMGYFRVFPKPGFMAKQRAFKRVILENATIRENTRRTPKFTPARDKIVNFHVGAVLLRSARSILDVSPFVLEDVATDATTSDP